MNCELAKELSDALLTRNSMKEITGDYETKYVPDRSFKQKVEELDAEWVAYKGNYRWFVEEGQYFIRPESVKP